MALVMPSIASIPKLDTPMARTLDFGRAIMAFQVSTRDTVSSSSISLGIVGWSGSRAAPGANAAGQWITGQKKDEK